MHFCPLHQGCLTHREPWVKSRLHRLLMHWLYPKAQNGCSKTVGRGIGPEGAAGLVEAVAGLLTEPEGPVMAATLAVVVVK